MQLTPFRGICLSTSVNSAPAQEHPPWRVWTCGRSTTNSLRKKAASGLRELYDPGPPHAFLVKFWADLIWGPSAEEAGSSGGGGGFYGVSSQYESQNWELMTLTCSSKVFSFGKQVVERVQREWAQLEDGHFVCRLLRSPMYECLVNFLHKLRQLPEHYMMDSVLENFTILQVVTNRDTQELLLCTAYVFEVSTSERRAQHIYCLVRD